uniref:Uncharacterized protein n=1 Tax=Meloidogyne hapla TaxID=6305 RepID=A0A1I8BFF0_MELHA
MFSLGEAFGGHRQHRQHINENSVPPTSLSSNNSNNGGREGGGLLLSAFGSPPPHSSAAAPPPHSLADLASTANSLLYALQSSQSNAVIAANTILQNFVSALPQQASSSNGQTSTKIENSSTSLEPTNNSNISLTNGLSNKYSKTPTIDDSGRFQQDIFNQQR